MASDNKEAIVRKALSKNTTPSKIRAARLRALIRSKEK